MGQRPVLPAPAALHTRAHTTGLFRGAQGIAQAVFKLRSSVVPPLQDPCLRALQGLPATPRTVAHRTRLRLLPRLVFRNAG